MLSAMAFPILLHVSILSVVHFSFAILYILSYMVNHLKQKAGRNGFAC